MSLALQLVSFALYRSSPQPLGSPEMPQRLCLVQEDFEQFAAEHQPLLSFPHFKQLHFNLFDIINFHIRFHLKENIWLKCWNHCFLYQWTFYLKKKKRITNLSRIHHFARFFKIHLNHNYPLTKTMNIN